MQSLKSLLLLLLFLALGVASGPKYRVLDDGLVKAQAFTEQEADASAEVVQAQEFVPSIHLPVTGQWQIDEDTLAVLSGIRIRILPNVPVLVEFNASRGKVSTDNNDFASV